MEGDLGARPPASVTIIPLFPHIQKHLVSLLLGLTDSEWSAPTVCPGWSVKDVALHLLGIDLGYLSGRRDGFRDPWWKTASGDTVDDINAFNQTWVVAARRSSARLLCELLAFTGTAVCDYLATVDLTAPGQSVWWVGPEPSPVWLDVAREYTERWVHQQQIRDAVGQPGLKEPLYLAPVIATFIHALPRALYPVTAPSRTVVRLVVVGEAGGRWIALRHGDRWVLGRDSGERASATVTMNQDVAWRLWTKGISLQDARPRVEMTGGREFTEAVLQMVSIIA